ncbi:MAG: ABC transporter ATP-binding protein [Pseudomonadales bacterium]|jgi:iron complex transport system ATP-binding protein|nr:ABC transporter ATP-binding protein [Pseudomonadales bacterium]MDP6471181.1 ABC transporter ATP-binding protein [Pseudomonadales bacterium]MDP6825632.1 ABC transporter ATP-binding protein [Pseudomonadales bacterium]MDP6970453.1 ABC transporter ATP-binding protein [Pseudomonadales bacterium]
MTELSARQVTVRAGGATLVDDVSLTLRPGELVAILGPNGAGKTSLLKVLVGLAGVTSGSVLLDGEDCYTLPAAQRARRISYLPQNRLLAWPNKVRDVVALGRFAHGAALGRLGSVDAEAVQDAMASCELEHLADRGADTLSGGELARMHFARAIAARTPLLVADEPVAALDPLHQLRIAQLIRQFVVAGGGALVVLHDVSLAVRFADRLVWMNTGRVVAQGTPAQTLNANTMADVYGVRARIERDELGFNVRIEGSL